MGGGMDTNIYIDDDAFYLFLQEKKRACLWQVVAFAPKVIIACLRQGFCIRKTR